MKNLIRNSRWQAGSNEGPNYFSLTGPITFDDFQIDGYRTCSTTLNGLSATCLYDLSIHVCHEEAIVFGFFMRAIEAENIVLQAEFLDASNNILQICKKDVQHNVCCEFHDVEARFLIPCGAIAVKLSLEFNGKVTACTFGGPFAFFCK